MLPRFSLVKDTPGRIRLHLTCPTYDSTNTQGLATELMTFLPKDPKLMELDFDDVEYLSGSMLGQLLTLHQRVRQQDGTLALVNLRPLLYELFQVTRLTTVLDVECPSPKLCTAGMS